MGIERVYDREGAFRQRFYTMGVVGIGVQIFTIAAALYDRSSTNDAEQTCDDWLKQAASDYPGYEIENIGVNLKEIKLLETGIHEFPTCKINGANITLSTTTMKGLMNIF